MTSIVQRQSFDLLRRGLQAQQRGDFRGAIGIFEKALIEDNRNITAYQALGDVLRLSGRVEEAAKIYRQGLERAPSHIGLLNNLAVAELLLNRAQRVAECCDRLLKIEPQHADALAKRAWAALRLGQKEQAETLLERTLALKPDSAFAWTVLGDLHRQCLDYQAALSAFQRVLKLEPRSLDARTNLAILYTALGIGQNAKIHLEAALCMNPNYVPALIAWAQYCRSLGDLAGAEETIISALCKEPDNSDALTVRGFIQLQQGNFAEGWKDYQERHRKSDAAPIPFPATAYWQGEKVEGVLLLLKEQGIGDEIMFASLIGEAAMRADRLIVQCDSRLVPLFRRAFPGIDFVTDIKEALFDRWAYIGDCCGHFRSRLSDFADKRAYLHPEPGQAASLREKYQRLFPGRAIIGISWKTKAVHTQMARSLSLDLLAKLLDLPRAVFVSLQYGDDIPSLPELYIDKEIDPWQDIDGVAAQIQSCDLVVTIDNSIAHLAGALGKETHLLLPKGSDWRWLEKRENSPWYPALRLWRQESPGEWLPIIEKVKKALLPRLTDDKSPAALFQKGQFSEAEQALRKAPQLPQHFFIAGQLALLEADFAKGWNSYEARFAADPSTPALRGPWPEWQGDWTQPLLLWGEQGLGEELLFSSLIPEALQRQKDITFLCDPRLVPLFKRSFSNLNIIGRGEKIDRRNLFHIPLGGLAKYLRPDLRSFHQHPSSWILPNSNLREFFRKKYEALAKGQPIIGLSWISHNPHSGKVRSLPIEQLRQQQKGFYVSLQFKPDQLSSDCYQEEEFDPASDIDAWAAQMAAMDHILTIDNSVANLAGAMGLSAEVFLGAAPDWRWLAAGGRTPWYPTLSLHRLTNYGVNIDDILRALYKKKYIEAACLCRLLHHQAPNDGSSWNLLGQILAKRHLPEEALIALHKAASLEPTNALTWLNIAHLAQGEEAKAALEKAEYLAPNASEIARAKVRLLRREAAIVEGGAAEALRLLLQAWQIARHPDLLADISAALFQQGRLKSAVKAAAKALRLDPTHQVARQNLSAALLDLGEIDRALEILQGPELSEELVLHKVTGLRAKGLFQEARKLLASLPSNAEVEFAKAMLELNAGEYEKGWGFYAARFARPSGAVSIAELPLTRWQGEKVNKLLILAEQGLGDEIMFAGYFNEVRRRCEQLVVEADARLHDIYQRSFPEVTFIPRGALKTRDNFMGVSCPLGDLPRLVRSTPIPQTYLKSDPGRVQILRSQYLDRFQGKRLIGINWRSHNKQSGALRTILPEYWRDLLNDPHFAFISLQYDPPPEDLMAFEALSPHFFADKSSDAKNDISFLANQIEAMDFLISIDNSTAHLSGALGKLTHLLLPQVTDWRWPYHANRAPWYEKVFLFRYARGLLPKLLLDVPHE